MNKIYAEQATSISELKKSPTKIIEKSGNQSTVILNHNQPSAYLVPKILFERMMDIINDYMLSKSAQKRLNEKNKIVEVDIEEL